MQGGEYLTDGWQIQFSSRSINSLSLFAPFVFFSDLLFLFWSEIVLNVERFSDFLRGLALNHVCNGFASEVEKRFDIQIVSSLKKNENKNTLCWFGNKDSVFLELQKTYQNKFKKGGLIHFAELKIPRNDVICSFFVFFLFRSLIYG
jgi:hypothetical protein